MHTAQLMPLPLTVSCFSHIQTGLPFWYRLTRVVPEKRPLNGCVCVCNCIIGTRCVCVANQHPTNMKHNIQIRRKRISASSVASLLSAATMLTMTSCRTDLVLSFILSNSSIQQTPLSLRTKAPLNHHIHTCMHEQLAAAAAEITSSDQLAFL